MAYQTSSRVCAAKRAIELRYSRAALSAMVSCWRAVCPSSWDAMTSEATNRLTSHSNGPTSVSSKSLTSNTIWRSGDEKIPKLERCASPHICTSSAVLSPLARSSAIRSAAPRKNARGLSSIRW